MSRSQVKVKVIFRSVQGHSITLSSYSNGQTDGRTDGRIVLTGGNVSSPDGTSLPYSDERPGFCVRYSRSHLRSAAGGDLAVPRSRTTTCGQRSFSVSGPSLWNSLPLSIRDPSLTMTQFCTHLKTFLFRRAYCT